ncbi:MAG: RNA polymerase sigma factor [Flavobacteriales bacterium]|nr:RNA polymerase sigma factor [Flavobacteriales bacterium]
MDREQFVAIISGEQKKLRRFLLALCCGNYEQADDIAQDTMVKAYLSCDKYQDRGLFKSWLYKIAYNTFLDYKKTSHNYHSLDECTHISDSTYEADRTFRYQSLYDALNLLPPKERYVILLFYMKGYQVKEICKIVSCGEAAVKKQLSRGREHLKHLLEYGER